MREFDRRASDEGATPSLLLMENAGRGAADVLRSRLLGALETQFRNESETAVTRMKDGVSPYTRFVTAERERAAQALETLAGLRRAIGALKARVETI